MPTVRYIDSLKNPRIPGFIWLDPENDGDRDMFKNILEYGCTIVCINPEEGSVCGRATNRIRSEADAGRHLKTGDERSDLFDLPHPVKFVPVDEKYFFDYIGYAAWFYRSLLFKVSPIAVHKFPVLQAVWADKNGFYPDDPKCHEVARHAQTLVEIPASPER